MRAAKASTTFSCTAFLQNQFAPGCGHLSSTAMSRQRSIRKKSVLSFDDEEEEEGPPLALPPAAKAAQAARDKQRKAQKKVLLSFDDVGGDADSGGPPSAKSRSGLPRASLRAPSAVAPPPVDERAQRINTQTSGAGGFVFACRKQTLLAVHVTSVHILGIRV